MRLLNEVLEAVRAMRALAIESAERCGGVEDVASELLFAVADALIDEYGRDGAMRTLANLASIDCDEFVRLTIEYREPIIGEEAPNDWEYPFYGMLMLTEPVIMEPIPIDEEAYDEGA